MNQIEYIEGDLFQNIQKDERPGTIFIPHVCNDKGAWGSGFVVPLGTAFPDSKTAYTEWHRTGENPDLNTPLIKTGTFGLGQTQFVQVLEEREVHGKTYPRVVVANMVAQTLGGRRPLSYKYLMKCMVQVAHHASQLSNSRIDCPMFGSGLAGGDWNFVERLIEDCWHQYEVRVHYLPRFLPDNWSLPENNVHMYEERP